MRMENVTPAMSGIVMHVSRPNEGLVEYKTTVSQTEAELTEQCIKQKHEGWQFRIAHQTDKSCELCGKALSNAES